MCSHQLLQGLEDPLFRFLKLVSNNVEGQITSFLFKFSTTGILKMLQIVRGLTKII
jgi:hypothetical protein